MKIDWFARGRDAMTEGKPSFIRDARISSGDRQKWYAGWHHQARLNSAHTIPSADRSEAVATLGKILTLLKNLP